MYEETLRWFLITVASIFVVSVVGACVSVLIWLVRVDRTEEEADWRKTLYEPTHTPPKIRTLKDYRSTDGRHQR